MRTGQILGVDFGRRTRAFGMDGHLEQGPPVWLTWTVVKSGILYSNFPLSRRKLVDREFAEIHLCRQHESSD
jgi:hypothetical protein